MIFRWYYFRRGFNFYHSGKYILLMHFFNLTPSRFLDSFIFIKCYIPSNIYMMESWNVYIEGFGDFIVSNKYSLLSRRIQLGSLLFRNMYIYRTTKYFEMASLHVSFMYTFLQESWIQEHCEIIYFAHIRLFLLLQPTMGLSWSWTMVFITSIMVIFFLFATPFCWGL